MWGCIPLWFWFAFSWWLMMLSIFSCTYWPSFCLLQRNIHSSPLPIFNEIICFLLLSCRSPLHILDINILSDIWFTNILSHFTGWFSLCWLFLSFWFSFSFSWGLMGLSNFSCIYWPFGDSLLQIAHSWYSFLFLMVFSLLIYICYFYHCNDSLNSYMYYKYVLLLCGLL